MVILQDHPVQKHVLQRVYMSAVYGHTPGPSHSKHVLQRVYMSAVYGLLSRD